MNEMNKFLKFIIVIFLGLILPDFVFPNTIKIYIRDRAYVDRNLPLRGSGADPRDGRIDDRFTRLDLCYFVSSNIGFPKHASLNKTGAYFELKDDVDIIFIKNIFFTNGLSNGREVFTAPFFITPFEMVNVLGKREVNFYVPIDFVGTHYIPIISHSVL